MKHYKDYMDNISADGELHEKIMAKTTPKQTKSRTFRLAYAMPLALCGVVLGTVIALKTFGEGDAIYLPAETTFANPVIKPPEGDVGSPLSQVILENYINECDSIAALVGAHPEFNYAFTFFEGDGFAYAEVKDAIYSNLQIFFEDYRAGKAYLITHMQGDAFSEFVFEQDVENDPLNNGRFVKARKLGEKGTFEEFRKAAAASGGEIQPAKLDYTKYIDKDGYMALEAITEYAYDKDRILDEMYLYYAFYRDFTVEQPPSAVSYFVNDRAHLKKFFDFYFALDYEIADTRFLPNATEQFILHIYIGDGYNNMRDFSFATDGVSYCYITSAYGSAYITREQYEWLKEWAEPVLEQQTDLAPLMNISAN